MALLLETALGDIVIDLDYKGSPALTRNVLQLAKANAYKSNLIYKVLPQRFCMTGCPVGDGSGGTSIQGLLKGTKTAVSTDTSRLLSPLEMQEKGRVAVQGQSMGSQFLITIDEGKDHALDGIEGDFYSIGIVTEDDNHVLDKINAAYLDPNNRPFADIRILSALVVYDPFENEHSAELIEYIKKCPSASPERPPQETVEKRISVDEIDMEDNEDDNSSVDERKQRRLQEEEQQREAQSRAVVLEMLGDLPSADMKAPENVLFICKLNPVTTDEDLELIFSRFDQAVKVEIIRDHDTGDSLQYAFAEFTTPEQAQEAYFKMNHALVDDRRILVDFSQSVAKLWDKYHQKMKFSRRADTYQSHSRQSRGPDERQQSSRHRRGEYRHGQGRGFSQEHEKNARNLQRRRNDHNHSYDQRHDRHFSKGASEVRNRDRDNDDDSFGRARHFREKDWIHKSRDDQYENSKDSSHKRYRGDDSRRHDKELLSSEEDSGHRGRDYGRRHKHDRKESERRSRKRSRKDEERRHRSESEKRRHKSGRHDEERRRSEREDDRSKGKKRERDGRKDREDRDRRLDGDFRRDSYGEEERHRSCDRNEIHHK
jgi:peptidyl-prolyl cis-trans isomerase-like 4